MRNYKNIIIVSLLLVLLAMSVGYSAFSGNLKLNGIAEIMGEWDVRITNVEVKKVSEGCDPGTPQYSNTSVTFDAKLAKPGDSITYLITIENAGTLDATLNNVLFVENGTLAISYSTTEIKENLKSGEITTFSVLVEYKSNYVDHLEDDKNTIIGIIEYVQS